MSFRISSAIFVLRVPNVVAGRTAAAPVGDLFKSGVGAVEARQLSAVALPASYGGIDVLRVDFDAVPAPESASVTADEPTNAASLGLTVNCRRKPPQRRRVGRAASAARHRPYAGP
jgi:hypothetical protein